MVMPSSSPVPAWLPALALSVLCVDSQLLLANNTGLQQMDNQMRQKQNGVTATYTYIYIHILITCSALNIDSTCMYNLFAENFCRNPDGLFI
jgi:hypothetical protein